MNKLGERAVVLGASMAGLLAARVLSEFYGTVTLVERDVLPEAAAHRRGVPQGRHMHALWSSGSHALGQLFPGLLDELVAAGANVLDEGDLSQASMRVRGHELNRSTAFTDPASVVVYLASRPFLESHVRRRVRAIANVTILDGYDVVAPVATDPHHITGARVVNRNAGEETVLDAELVVDAMGRAARTPAFLENLGFGRPVEQRSSGGPLSYSSQLLAIPAGVITEKVTGVLPVPGQSDGGGLLAYEDGTWLLTVARLAGREPPTDLAGVISLTAQFAPPSLVAALRAAEPIGDVSVFRFPGGVWRRYDKMRRFPAGLLVFGDAICSFNPIYGQGMTVAVREAVALRDCLANDARTDLSRRFFRAAAKQIRPVWLLNQLNDYSLWQIDGRPSVLKRMMSWEMDKAISATANDAVLTEAVFRVMNLVDPPTRLLHPFLMARMVAAKRLPTPEQDLEML